MSKQLIAVLVSLALAVVGVGCGSEAGTAPTAVSPGTVTVPSAFTVTVSASTPVVFFAMFGSRSSAATLTAQRSPAGALSGGWNSSQVSTATLAQNGLTATATPVGAGLATITFADTTGPSGSTVLRSAPTFDAGTTIGGRYVVASCSDTTPAGTTTTCNDPGGLANTLSTYSFNVTSTASGSASPVVVNVGGTFRDGLFGTTPFPIVNAPSIDAGGSFSAIGTRLFSLPRPGGLSPISAELNETWNITAASQDSFTGSSTVIITPSGSNCGGSGGRGGTAPVPCSGNVTIRRNIQTASRQ
jgi:hypothetical protein